MCVSVHTCVFVPPLPFPPPVGGRSPSAQRPVSSSTPSSSPLSARQLGSCLCGIPGRWGLTFTLHPLTSAPPLPVDPAIHMQASRHQPILLFHLSTPGQAAVSRLKFKSRDRAGRPGPGHDRPGAQGRGRLLIFYGGGQRDMV